MCMYSMTTYSPIVGVNLFNYNQIISLWGCEFIFQWQNMHWYEEMDEVVCHFYHNVHGGCLRGKEAKEETLTGMEMTAHGSACLWSDRLIIILEYMGQKTPVMSQNSFI